MLFKDMPLKDNVDFRKINISSVSVQMKHQKTWLEFIAACYSVVEF